MFEYLTPNLPFDRVHSDIVGLLLVCTDGHRYILTNTCAMTKFLILTPSENQAAEKVSTALIDVVCKHSMPRILITNRETNHLSHTFTEVCKLLGIEHHPLIPYHHEANGQVERLVKIVIDTLAAYVVNTKEE
ncbi:unnamed protein product [Gongylonema pulchrum]|uniref:Integrase catalytic domain-containing protein n=1 Tax=Gongylonema pulchrum TaxID=637853 RepID=A0A183EVW1_9BILA|nr:unnamed protein product [Gongylonema pulchrum]